MGQELLCRVHFGDRNSSGKALLETAEIIFRGEFRLKVPLASLTSVAARDGKLHLEWPDASAIFELGPQAEKWAHKIQHPRSTAEKLGIKPGLVISALRMGDGDFVKELKTSAKSFSETKALKGSDLIFCGASTKGDLAKACNLAGSLSSRGALWIIYPKGQKTITEQQVLSAGRAAGLVDVKVVSFSDTHTALKFVIPKANR